MTGSRARLAAGDSLDLPAQPAVAAQSRDQLTVAVIGAAGALGNEVVRGLAAASYAGVVAIDAIATPAGRRGATVVDSASPTHVDVAWRTADVRHPAFPRSLEGVDVLVHAAIAQDPDTPSAPRRARNIEGTTRILEAALAAGVRRVVVLSSAMVYGAHPDNPTLLTEAHPMRAASDDSIVGDLILIEQVLADFAVRHPAMAIVVLRPTTIVGPGCDGVLTRHFETTRLLAIRGVAARWQFVHISDVAAACVLAVDGALHGIVNVAPPATLSQADLEAITGSRRIELPASVVFGAADRLHRAGVTLAPAGEIAYLAYPWAIDSLRLLEAGWRPSHDSAGALRAHLQLARSAEGRGGRLGRDDATRAAAGATVALLGTAALLRRARRRRP